jgi:c(7)-type cytochrome triheme protein
VARNDANAITMDAIFLGKYCGVCHDKVAFSNFVCERCHSIPHEGSPAKWW